MDRHILGKIGFVLVTQNNSVIAIGINIAKLSKLVNDFAFEYFHLLTNFELLIIVLVVDGLLADYTDNRQPPPILRAKLLK